jgi:AraC family transcriptional regulator of adaptative response/methylated-DNA-[protein]-cysteine methyltransferase
MKTTVSRDDLYALFLARDPRGEALGVAAVLTTGIYCRLTCPAPKPKRQNVVFLPSPHEAEAQGFRACKRCWPSDGQRGLEPWIRDLAAQIENDDSVWSEDRLRALGYDPSTVRRAFKRHFGVTFLQMVRGRRLRRGIETTARGGAVIGAQLDAGFGSASGFRAAMGKLLGRPAQCLKTDGKLKARIILAPLGAMLAVADEKAVRLLEFADRTNLAASLLGLEERTGETLSLGSNDVLDRLDQELTAYFAGESARFTVPLTDDGTPFFLEARRALAAIPPGELWSYAELAKVMGRPTAVRAVARANATNRLAILLPCHRVVAADGSLSGYAGGVWRKRWLIDHEAKHFRTRDDRADTSH